MTQFLKEIDEGEIPKCDKCKKPKTMTMVAIINGRKCAKFICQNLKCENYKCSCEGGCASSNCTNR